MARRAGFSVVVCCHDSAHRIRETLGHLARLQPPAGSEVEIVLVDNRSADATTAVARAAWGEVGSEIPLLVVDEPELGLSAARRRGISAARFDVIVFCDDDNLLAESYLVEARRILVERPSVGAICGRSVGRYEIEPPDWVHRFEEALAIGHHGRPAGPLDGRTIPWGAGLVMRVEIFDRLRRAGFRALLGDRRGAALTSGGDTEYCVLARAMGYEWWYEPAMRLEHVIARERLSEAYFRQLYREFGRAECLVQYYYQWGDSAKILDGGPLNIGAEHTRRRAELAVRRLRSLVARASLGRDLETERLKGIVEQLRREAADYPSRYAETREMVARLVSGATGT